ncbi:biopolymer transporter ExbD [Luteolibacter sp. LG18]|uniref:ExbD/TolR family protein n=1 Tax=Luteolibacter sp. LG18 TaxID=2819286 RepID=UPI002B299578|nr:hypothetical protein llg_31880 [Luteolibacter sp. LG18]
MKASLRRVAAAQSGPGFQIAPMIDVVFVIMLYFMVMAGAVPKEGAHRTLLPALGEPSDDPPLELTVRIDEDGQVALNDDLLDSPESTSLPELAGQLQDAKAVGGEVLVTINAAEDARYQRIIDVLDAVGLAEIRNVTFTSGGE